jgi:hypothetical protein
LRGVLDSRRGNAGTGSMYWLWLEVLEDRDAKSFLCSVIDWSEARIVT